MEHGLKLLEQACYSIIFCIAVTWLISYVRNYEKVFHILKEQETMDHSVLYETRQQERGLVTDISSEELIASLLTEELEYDIEIDGIHLGRQSHRVDKIMTYGIKNCFYHKSYQYNEEGEIIRIAYRSM